jgi:hypothetical protein
MSRTGAALLFVVSAACGGVTAEERAAMAKLQIVVTEPGFTCQNLGDVSGSYRLQAVRLGANIVRLDTPTSASGIAFYCPPPSGPAPSPPVVQP